jgi:hypothetical protein
MFNDDSGIEDSLCSSINVNLSFDIDATRESVVHAVESSMPLGSVIAMFSGVTVMHTDRT